MRTDNSPANILLVDDNPQNLKVLGTCIQEMGHSPMFATGAEEAREAVEALPPDLILLDLMMPRIDGFTYCDELKKNEKTRNIPVVFITASQEREDLIKAFNLGAVDYITKPFNPAEVRVRVNTHLQLYRANKQLAELLREKDDFIGIAAHHLKNLLCVVGVMNEMIELNDEQKSLVRYNQNIRDAQGRMLETIHGLLQLNKLESGNILPVREVVNCQQQLRILVDIYRQRAQQKQQSLLFTAPETPLIIHSDRNFFYQIAENLISNAVKYTPLGKCINVEIDQSNEGILLTVLDEGPGIAEAEREKVFDKFVRLENQPTGGESSTGLGLSIVRQMVKTLKGRVWCESEVGSGTSFKVYLPADIDTDQIQPGSEKKGILLPDKVFFAQAWDVVLKGDIATLKQLNETLPERLETFKATLDILVDNADLQEIRDYLSLCSESN